MINKLVEEEGKQPAAGGMATAQQKIEKQARQLAYDTRYQVKKEVGDKKVNPASMKRLLLQRLQKSTAAPNVKVRAKQMLIGEDYIGDVSDFAADTIANALFKVFVENKKVEVQEEIELEYLKELDENPDRKYKVRVTDKKTGNSYVRYATREKITQLRTNPNIQSVEMTEYGEPREGERKRGESTAKAKSGKGLDPVGKEDKDIDNDGDHDKTDKYLLNRRKVRGAAIAKKKGVAEEFLADAAEDQNDSKVTGKGVNNYGGKNPVVKIMPEDSTVERQQGVTPRSVYAHTELEGELIAETGYSKFLNMLQEREMTSGEKTKEKKLKKKYDPSEMKASMVKQYGPEKGKDVYFATIRKQAMGEEMDSERQDDGPKTDKGKKCEDDMRSLPTKMNLVKNKLRAMGLKMSYDPEGEVLDERTKERKGKPRPERDRAMEVVRSMPNVKQGLMTRSGKTVAQHEAERGVPERDRPKKPEQTTADRLAIRKQKEAAAKAAKERTEREEERRRRLA